jgi:hypothetical protein
LYPRNEEERDESQRLFEFIRNEGQPKSYIGRIQGPDKQTNAALMELRVALYLKDSGFPVVEWSPVGACGREGEFVVEGPAKQRIFVEVKGPEWQSEVPRDELRAGRSTKPKYIDMECRRLPPRSESIQFAIRKAYGKFRHDVSNLLVVADDLFVSLEHETDFEAEEALYSDWPTNPGYFSDRRYEKLGGVGLFWVNRGSIWESEHKRGRLNYQMRLYLNPNALSSTALPPDVHRALRDEPIEPKGPFLVGREPSPLEKYLANPSEWK